MQQSKLPAEIVEQSDMSRVPRKKIAVDSLIRLLADIIEFDIVIASSAP